MSGSRRDQVQEAHHRRLRVEHRLVHVDVDHLRAVLHLLARDLDGAGEVAGEDQLARTPRAGDVRALADVDEQRVVADVERLETGEAQRTPLGFADGVTAIAANSASATARAVAAHRDRGAIARMWSGVVPQHPPTMLTKPLRANSRSIPAVCAGVSS